MRTGASPVRTTTPLCGTEDQDRDSPLRASSLTTATSLFGFPPPHLRAVTECACDAVAGLLDPFAGRRGEERADVDGRRDDEDEDEDEDEDGKGEGEGEEEEG